MEHHIKDARRRAENTLAEVNRHMENAQTMRNPRNVAMLTSMKREALDAIEKADRITSRMDRSNRYRNDINDDLDDALDMLDRLLPHIRGDDDAENAVRVRGYTRRKPGGGRVRVPGYTRRSPSYRADMDDWDDDDYADDMDNRRRRDRYGRFMDMDDVARTAADVAAETARRMADDRRNIYPHPPVMPHDDRRNDDRGDTNIGPGTRR